MGKESLNSFLQNSLRKIANPELDLSQIDTSKHLHFDYGLDSLGYEKLILMIEMEYNIQIPTQDKASGFFASLGGIQEYLKEYFAISET